VGQLLVAQARSGWFKPESEQVMTAEKKNRTAQWMNSVWNRLELLPDASFSSWRDLCPPVVGIESFFGRYPVHA
jgi:hypothetical protein